MISIAKYSNSTDNWDVEIRILSYPDIRLLNILDFLENVDLRDVGIFGRYSLGRKGGRLPHNFS